MLCILRCYDTPLRIVLLQYEFSALVLGGLAMHMIYNIEDSCISAPIAAPISPHLPVSH